VGNTLNLTKQVLRLASEKEPRMSKKYSYNDVAIVIPIYRSGVHEDERYAIRHLQHFLSDYHCFIVAPQGLPKDNFSDYPFEYFNPHYFANYPVGYNHLLMSEMFYQRFADFRFMLIYQLDALVFSDRLLEFCSGDWDYIGAPWFKSEQSPTKGFSRVGNGGFSLRKVRSFLDVLQSNEYQERNLISNCLRLARFPFSDLQQDNFWMRYLKIMNTVRLAHRGISTYLEKYRWNEDLFWSDRAVMFKSDFKVAPIEVSLEFAFEKFPRYCFEQNGSRLPFGCHNWYRYDRTFWQAYLREESSHDTV
jgi:hypothetical protein